MQLRIYKFIVAGFLYVHEVLCSSPSRIKSLNIEVQKYGTFLPFLRLREVTYFSKVEKLNFSLKFDDLSFVTEQ